MTERAAVVAQTKAHACVCSQFPLDVSFNTLSGQPLHVPLPGPFQHGSYVHVPGEGLWFEADTVAGFDAAVNASASTTVAVQPMKQRGSLIIMLVQA